MTARTDRMIQSAPPYYLFSAIYAAIQAAQGDEYDSLAEQQADLRNQLYISTATWGLRYWEAILQIPTVESDSYPIRRSRVLSRWRGVGNFSAALIKSVALAYTNGNVDVAINTTTQEITITFIDAVGLPPNIEDMQAAVDSVVHAHLGVTYQYRYLTVTQVQALTITAIQARPLTDFAPFTPV